MTHPTESYREQKREGCAGQAASDSYGTVDVRGAAAPPIARRLHNLIWTLRDRSFRNPPWPDRVDSLLFLCVGNICRSPFAARLTARRLAEAGLTRIRCTSAGTQARPGFRPPSDAVQAAAAYGIDLEHHHPQLFNERLLKGHDVIFVMEPWQLAMLRRRFPAERRRFFLMPRFEVPPAAGAFERLHFVDPLHRGPQAFADVYARIDRAVAPIVEQVAAQFGR